MSSLSSVERMFRSIWIRARVVAIAAFVAFASLWLGSERAEAACGDYVHVRGRLLHTAGESMREPARSSSEAALHDSIVGTNRLPTRLPCRGPSCSNDSGSPAAPAPKIESSQEQLACVVSAGLPHDPGCGVFVAVSDADRPEGFVLGILRPPR